MARKKRKSATQAAACLSQPATLMVPSSPKLSASAALSNREVVSATVNFLAAMLRVESEIPEDGDNLPSLPSHWTGPFASLARVNQAFFYASTTVLWETMGSLKPYLDLLSLNSHHRLSTAGLLSVDWTRFGMYSSKTKTLVLKREATPVMATSWDSYLLLFATPTRPAHLFPAVKRLFISSTDSLSLTIALSIIPNTTLLRIDLGARSNANNADSNEVCAALTAAALQHAPNLTSLGLINTPHGRAISNAVKIVSLTTLHLKIKREITMELLLEIENLALLETLCLDQEHDRGRPAPARSNLFSKEENVDATLSRESRLKRLRHLEVRGNGITHALVASTLSPRKLSSLTLDVYADINEKHNLFIPLVITVYAKRNSRLTSIAASSAQHFNAGDWSFIRDDIPHIVDADRFKDSLASLKKLQVLKISRIPFFAVDIIARVLDSLPRFERLKQFYFEPNPVSRLEGDRLIYPSIHCLEILSKLTTTQGASRATRLREFCTIIDISNVPTCPQEYISEHPLKSLTILATPRTGNPSNSRHTLSLAVYLDRLFPSLTSVTDMWDEDRQPEEWKYWEFIDQLMKVLRSTRILTLRDVGIEVG